MLGFERTTAAGKMNGVAVARTTGNVTVKRTEVAVAGVFETVAANMTESGIARKKMTGFETGMTTASEFEMRVAEIERDGRASRGRRVQSRRRSSRESPGERWLGCAGQMDGRWRRTRRWRSRRVRNRHRQALGAGPGRFPGPHRGGAPHSCSKP